MTSPRARERRLIETPDLGQGELWPARPEIRARLTHLPTFPPFARVVPLDQPGAQGIFVETGLVLCCADLKTPMPVPAALALTHQLAEIFAVLHDEGAGHGSFSPSSVGWTRDGSLLVRPDPALVNQDPDHQGDNIQALDCQSIGAVLWACLGGPWPLPEPERDAARLLSPGIPAQVAQLLPRLCHDDDRLELLLRGMLRWGGSYRLAPARAVRQAVSALRFRHGASEQALAAYLSDHQLPLAPTPRRPEPNRRPSLFSASRPSDRSTAVASIAGPISSQAQPASPSAEHLRSPLPAAPAQQPPLLQPGAPSHPVPPSSPPASSRPTRTAPTSGAAYGTPRRRVTIDIPVQDDFPLIDKDGFFVAPPSLLEDDEDGPRKVVELQNTIQREGAPADNQERLAATGTAEEAPPSGPDQPRPASTMTETPRPQGPATRDVAPPGAEPQPEGLRSAELPVAPGTSPQAGPLDAPATAASMEPRAEPAPAAPPEVPAPAAPRPVVEPPEAAELPEAAEPAEAPEPPEAPEAPEAAELPEAAEPPEAPEAAELPEAAEAPEAPEAAELPEAAEPPEAPEAAELPEAAEPPEAPAAAELPEAAEAPEAPAAAELPEAAEPPEAPEAAELPEAAEAPEAPEAAELPEAAEPPEAPEVAELPEAAEAPEAPAAAELPEAAEPPEAPEAAELPEAAEPPEVPAAAELPEAAEPPAAPAAAELPEAAEPPEAPALPEALAVPEPPELEALPEDPEPTDERPLSAEAPPKAPADEPASLDDEEASSFEETPTAIEPIPEDTEAGAPSDLPPRASLLARLVSTLWTRPGAPRQPAPKGDDRDRAAQQEQPPEPAQPATEMAPPAAPVPTPVVPEPTTSAPLDPEEPTNPDRETPPRKELFERSANSSEDADWMSGVGISERHEREQELGAGKWTEPARSLEEVAASMPSDPIREMRIRSGGLPVKPMLLAAGLAALLGWLMLRDKGEDEPTPSEVPAQEEPEPSEIIQVAPAASDAPEVTIWTDLEGARVELDGRDQGVAPTRIPVPLDSGVHELCLIKDTLKSCRQLTGEELAMQDPYAFTLGDSP
jgi:hypothetical protein